MPTGTYIMQELVGVSVRHEFAVPADVVLAGHWVAILNCFSLTIVQPSGHCVAGEPAFRFVVMNNKITIMYLCMFYIPNR